MIDDTIRAIKRSLHQYMNGVTARSLRAKGSHYKVVWGVTAAHLQEIASEYSPDSALAKALWQQDDRECKLLATLLMPLEAADICLVRAWMGEISTEELAEMFVFNLVQHCPFALQIAEEWLSSDALLTLQSAFNLFGRLFYKGIKPNQETARMFVDRAVAALTEDNALRHAAMNSLVHFANIDKDCYTLAKECTQERGFDFI